MRGRLEAEQKRTSSRSFFMSEECKAECPLLVVRRVNESFESFGDFCGRFESFEGQSFKRLLL
jgi:hypothetical protein